jgi:hypothetical protein
MYMLQQSLELANIVVGWQKTAVIPGCVYVNAQDLWSRDYCYNIIVDLQEFANVPVVCLRPYLVYLHSLRRVCSAGSHQVRQFY